MWFRNREAVSRLEGRVGGFGSDHGRGSEELLGDEVVCVVFHGAV